MEKKLYGRRDFLVEIARLYYIENQNQTEISAQFNITRSNVSKLLKRCREEGIVQIHIAEPSSKVLMMGSRLKQRFGLKEAVVVPSEKTCDETLVTVGRNAVGRKAAVYLQSIMKDGIRIGIGWGTSLFQMVKQLPRIDVRGASVVQLQGGLAARNLVIDGYELARNLAKKLKASTYLIQAPLVVQTKELRDMLLKEPHIAEGLEIGERVDVAFLGIGTSEPRYGALLRAGFVNEEESLALYSEGAVGMICGNYFDREGRLLDSSINDRIVGFDLAKLKDLPLTIGVASGEQKGAAVLGALRGGYINAVFTDETAAKIILEQAG